MQIDKHTQAEKTRKEEDAEREKKKGHRQINKHRQWQLESKGTWTERKERHRQINKHRQRQLESKGTWREKEKRGTDR